MLSRKLLFTHNVFAAVLLQSPMVVTSRFVEAMYVLNGVRGHAEFASTVAEIESTASEFGA